MQQASFVCELPKIKVLVKESFLTQDDTNTALVEAYLVSAHCRYGRPIFFTIHLASGGLWSMLPIHAIVCLRYDDEALDSELPTYPIEALQPYSCLEGPVQAIAPDYLRNYEMRARVNGQMIPATYLFTIDYGGTGMAEDPEQYKSHNVCVLENGQLAALPNNYCLFIDAHFTGKELQVPKYKRGNKFYLPGS